MSRSDSKFLPNAFQTPNAYVDQYMGFLTPEEYVVLSYTVRRIFGFQERSARISVTQYEEGLIEDGRHLDYGTGLSRDAIRKALTCLLDFNLMIEIAPGDPARHLGPEYALQLDSNAVNLPALRKRVEEKRHKDRARSEKARGMAVEANREKRSPSVRQTAELENGNSPHQNAESAMIPDPPSVGQTPDSAVCATDSAPSVGQMASPSVGQTIMNKEEKQLRKTVEKQDHAPTPSGAARSRASPAVEKKETSAEEKAAINDRHMEIMAGYQAELKYAHDMSREARAAKKLAQLGYTWDRVCRYYQALKATTYWFDRHLALEVIARDIGAWELAQNAGGPPNGRTNGTGASSGIPYAGNGHGRAQVPKNGMAGTAMPDGTVEAERAKRRARAAALAAAGGKETAE